MGTPALWKGANILGWALMQSRAHIRIEKLAERERAKGLNQLSDDTAIVEDTKTANFGSEPLETAGSSNIVASTHPSAYPSENAVSHQHVEQHDGGHSRHAELWDWYVTDDGRNRKWWYNEASGESFFEDNPGPWERWLFDDLDCSATDHMRGWWSHSVQTDRFFLEPPN